MYTPEKIKREEEEFDREHIAYNCMRCQITTQKYASIKSCIEQKHLYSLTSRGYQQRRVPGTAFQFEDYIHPLNITDPVEKQIYMDKYYPIVPASQTKKKNQCDLCDKQLYSKSGLSNHRRICLLKQTAQQTSLVSPNEHQSAQEQITHAFNCQICQKTCKSAGGLTKHYNICKNKQPKPEKTNQCDLCNKTCKSYRGMRIHRHHCVKKQKALEKDEYIDENTMTLDQYLKTSNQWSDIKYIFTDKGTYVQRIYRDILNIQSQQ